MSFNALVVEINTYTETPTNELDSKRVLLMANDVCRSALP